MIGSTEPDGNISPVTTADGNSMTIVSLANSSLVEVDTAGKLVPQLATKWSASGDGLTWTITLRKGAKFSDGSPVTVKDAVDSFTSLLAPNSQSPAKSSFTGIVKSVAAGSGDSTVVFRLERPYSDFPYLLAGANTYILPSGVNDADWIHHPVGAGQFVLESYTPGQGVVYKKNPNYWDAANVKLDGVDIKFYADQQSELLAFQSGEIDSIEAGSQATASLKSADYREVKSGYVKFDGIVFNVTKAPFDDVKVRQAVAWALDRKAIVDTVYGGAAKVANDVPTFPDYLIQPTGLTTREKDLAKVKSLIGDRKIAFTITTYQGEQTLAELVQQQLNATGNFTVKLDIKTPAAYYADGASTPWLNAPVTITDWAERLPSQYIGLLYAKSSSWNASHYSNPALEKLAAKFDATTDPTEQQSLANQIAAIE
ncbi:hypothetical protein LK09_14135 [Microbacterium mangrovi]|uniref:Solute-binding protein family 5 domain-containing protein n=1 Tax=Microbacterium mangrovi TaxID=1348253 RepID=A0A0B2A547_9MICO|nr:hypothetical protein LK09_14135 [Microbacterium mangrovi]